MKRKAIITLVTVASIVLAGCSNKGLIPERTRIYGPLGEYFSIVAKEYPVNDGNINIEIERIEEGFPSPYEKDMKIGYSAGEAKPGFTVEFLDKKGNVIDKTSTDIVYSRDDLTQLAVIRVGETSSIKFNVPKGAVKFKMTSDFECRSYSKTGDFFEDAEEIYLKEVEDATRAIKGVLEMEKNILDNLF